MSILLKHLHDRAAHAHPNPTEGQQRAGNYRKGHVKAHGLDVTIENAKGSIRRGTGRDGKPWQVRMAFPYGYIKRTTGADGDHVDVTIGPHLKCPRIYVVDQRDADTGKFDEHKVYMGFASADHVRRAYRQGFSDRRGDDRMGAITEMSPDQFRSWLKDGDTTKPLHRAAGGRVGYDDGGEVLDDSVSRGFGALSQTWPARMARSVYDAVTLPGDVYSGRTPITGDDGRTNPEVINRAADLAGVMVGTPGGSGGLGSHLRGLPTSELSFSQRMELGKELAMERSNRGFSTGSQGRGYSVSPDAPRGSFDRLYQEQRSYWNQDKDAALNAYRESIDPSHGAMLAPVETLDDMAREFTLGSGATDKRTAAIAQGIRAYHGSPHDFDRFDLSKIGTGEGAQAYGHGLYFAENPKVAMDYRNKLSEVTAPGFYQFGGKEFIGRTGPEAHALSLAYHDTPQTARRIATEGLAAANAGEPWALEMGGVPYWQQMKAQADMIRSKRDIGFSQGRMYEVNINAHPDQFVNWDKPLHQQTASGITDLVRGGLKDKGYLGANENGPRQLNAALRAWKMEHGGMAETPMEALLSGRSGLLGSTPEELANTLRDAGIPGVRYLDQGSRGRGGRQSRNYAVFDDKLVNILRKYKKGGAVGYAEGGSITDADMGFGGGSGGSSMTDADMGFGASPAAAPAPKKPDNGPTFWGTMGQAALGVPRGLLDIAGALGEAVTAKPLRDVAAAKAAAAAQTEGGVEFTPEDAQRAAFRKTMETTPSYGHQMREAVGLEGQMAPKNAAERIASGVGEGAAGAVLAPGAMLPNAVLGGFAGGVGRGAAEVAPDPYKPIAELAGNVLGVAAGAGAAAIPGVASRGVSRMVKPVTQAGQEEIAARYLESRMANPDAVRQTLQQPTQEIIPGSKPTLFQETGDMGLGALERENLQTRAPQDFMQRRADQNAARLDTIENLVASGDPRDVSRAVTAQMNAIDTATQQAVDRLTREARDRAAAIGGHNAPEAYGAELRTALRSAEDEARMYERALWDNVDPTNSMTIDMRPLQQAHAAIYGDLTAAARASLSPSEQTVANLMSGYNGVMPFRELTDARSLVSSAMREELKDRGKTPAYARLAQLRGAMEDRINGIVTERAADDAARVAAGEMPSEQALASRIQQLVAEWQSGRAAGADIAAGNGQAAAVRPAARGPEPGADSTQPGRLGADAGDQGVQGATFDANAAERLRDATRATRERATTFNADPLKGILRREQQGGPYVMRDAMVPEKVFRPGPAGAQDLGRFVDAVGAERALPVISDYAASSLRRSAMDADGMIDPARFDTWRRRHSEALRAVPGLERRFSDAARAAQQVADATALRRSAINEAQQGVFGRLIGAEDVQDIRKVVGSTLSSAAETKRLMAAVRGHPGGLDGMRRAVVDYMTSKLISNTEGATTGRGLIKSDQFQTFVRQHEDSLRAVLTPEQFATLRNVADDLQRANRSLTAVKIPGQSNTAQDFYATMEGASRLGQLMANLASGATSMASRVVPGGRHAMTGAEIAVNAARTAGFSKVDALVRQALLDPEFARLLLQKVPHGTARAADRVFARRLLSLSAADMARYSQTEGNRQ